ncbi:diacylglycerol/lipid kinase family protein [Ruania halotolerans]|uniref:diacylglycerol/lipid kinase family protein n=1 Tax=Ruania halotolerans TaxID=2897773 RepID=UPI001E2E1D4B|nr:diacylglycerol kinase family protein [Ruania halotolerans]UFU06939.1 diacylglycerol kinase [Ruania halotolerans]
MAQPRAAVVYHPDKATGPRWRRVMNREERRAGWEPSIWVPTQANDTAETLRSRLVEAGGEHAEVVIAAGGDGTVRLTAEVLAGTEQPLGLWPIGSTNLFARNVGLPVLDQIASLRAALTGADRRVDTGRLTADLADGQRLHRTFLVLAGFGVDAQMVVHTSAEAKEYLGWLAYVAGVTRGMTRSDRIDVTYSLDGDPPQDARLLTLAIANGGALPAGLVLLPDAEVDDGELDLLLLHADDAKGWREVASWFLQENGAVRRLRRKHGHRRPLRTGAAVLVRRTRDVRLTLRHPEHFQVDGEYLGQVVRLRAQVDHGSLLVRVPAKPVRQT